MKRNFIEPTMLMIRFTDDIIITSDNYYGETFEFDDELPLIPFGS